MLGAGHDTGRIFRNCTDFVTAKTPRARRHTKTFLFGFFALLASLRLQSCVGQPLRVQSECHPDRGPEPAGGSESWPRPGQEVGLSPANRPLAGDGASRRPKAVSKGPSGGIYGFLSGRPKRPFPQIPPLATLGRDDRGLATRAAKQREGAKDAKNNPKINLCDVFASLRFQRRRVKRYRGARVG